MLKHTVISQNTHLFPQKIENSINLILSVSDPEDIDSQNSTVKNSDEAKITKSNTFGGISENGIIIGQGGVEGSWVCNIPDSMITTRLNNDEFV